MAALGFEVAQNKMAAPDGGHFGDMMIVTQGRASRLAARVHMDAHLQCMLVAPSDALSHREGASPSRVDARTRA
jgi:hypothetical protein